MLISAVSWLKKARIWIPFHVFPSCFGKSWEPDPGHVAHRESMLYPQKSKPRACPVHMWLLLSSTNLVFHSIEDRWLLLTRQWTGMGASGTAQLSGLVSRQGKGQDTEIPVVSGILNPCHCFTNHTLLLILWFSDTGNFFVTKTVVYLETKSGVGDMAVPEHISRNSAFSDHNGGRKVEEWLISPLLAPESTCDSKGHSFFCSLFPVCPHAFPFSSFSLVSLVILTQTLALT